MYVSEIKLCAWRFAYPNEESVGDRAGGEDALSCLWPEAVLSRAFLELFILW